MKKTALILLFIFSTFLIGCVEGDKVDMQSGDKVIFMVQVEYIVEGKTKADKGATIYLFENFTDTENYTFENGKYINKETEQVIDFQQKSEANDIGIAMLETVYGQECTVVVQSAAYPSQYTQSQHNLNGNQSQIGLGKISFKEKTEQIVE